MTTKKIASKGYTLEVHSYDRDDENHNMAYLTFDTKNEFLLVKHMCENIFISGYNHVEALGKCLTQRTEANRSVMVNYLVLNPGLLELNNISAPSEDDIKTDPKISDILCDLVMKYHNKVIGFSGTSYYRVCHTCTGYYSDKDIYLDVL